MYYTYAYLREDGTPYYIGKGKGRRAYTHHHHRCAVPSEDRILFLKKGLTNEEAIRHEIYLISVLGRKDLGTGILRNLTDGGEGTHNVSPLSRQKMSEAQKGNTKGRNVKWSDEDKKRMSEQRKGRKLSEETKRKMSAVRKGRKLSDEHRQNISKSRMGIEPWNKGLKRCSKT